MLKVLLFFAFAFAYASSSLNNNQSIDTAFSVKIHKAPQGRNSKISSLLHSSGQDAICQIETSMQKKSNNILQIQNLPKLKIQASQIWP